MYLRFARPRTRRHGGSPVGYLLPSAGARPPPPPFGFRHAAGHETPPPRHTKTPSLRSGYTKATGSACAPCSWCPAATRLNFRVARGAGVLVCREGGFRVPKPCRRPTGLSGGMPHGEGRRPSSRGGIPTRWPARCAGRLGFGRSWSRVAQKHTRFVEHTVWWA